MARRVAALIEGWHVRHCEMLELPQSIPYIRRIAWHGTSDRNAFLRSILHPGGNPVNLSCQYI